MELDGFHFSVSLQTHFLWVTTHKEYASLKHKISNIETYVRHPMENQTLKFILTQA